MATQANYMAGEQEKAPVRELRDSFMLLALMASTLGTYVGVGILVVRIFATAR